MALLRLERISVLILARDTIGLGNDFRRFQHRHINVGAVLDQPGVLLAIAVHMLVLEQRD
jgi:hypothetical protein